MSGSGFSASPMVVPEGWTAAYARLHHDGLAHFPPACLYYVMNVVRQASQVSGVLGDTDASDLTGERPAPEPFATRSIPPSAVITAFRSAVRADFGSLRDDVLEDWGLRTPADLGAAVSLLGRAGTLKLDEGDEPEFYAADVSSFAGELP